MPLTVVGQLYGDTAYSSPSVAIYNGTTSGTSAVTLQNLQIWASWTDSTATTISVPSTIWPRWVGDAYGAYATNQANAYNNYANTYNNYNQAPLIDQRTPAQVIADEAAHAARLADELQRHAARVRAKQDASARARVLLESMLTEQQRGQLARDKFFEIVSRGSRRRYRIHHGTHGNVRLLDDKGREVTSYCGQPTGVPTEDAMLAQMLQLVHDEEGFLRAANATRRLVA